MSGTPAASTVHDQEQPSETPVDTGTATLQAGTAPFAATGVATPGKADGMHTWEPAAPAAAVSSMPKLQSKATVPAAKCSTSATCVAAVAAAPDSVQHPVESSGFIALPPTAANAASAADTCDSGKAAAPGASGNSPPPSVGPHQALSQAAATTAGCLKVEDEDVIVTTGPSTTLQVNPAQPYAAEPRGSGDSVPPSEAHPCSDAAAAAAASAGGTAGAAGAGSGAVAAAPGAARRVRRQTLLLGPAVQHPLSEQERLRSRELADVMRKLTDGKGLDSTILVDCWLCKQRLRDLDTYTHVFECAPYNR